jgi:hypothetical protein
MKRIPYCLALALLSACSHRSTPVRLQGDPVSIAWLGGAWQGEYWSASSSGRGSLRFYLESGTESVVGEIAMVDPAGHVIHPADRADVHRLHVRTTQLLHIDFVAVRADTIRGVLEPYVAPECACIVSTTFVGKVLGNEVTGTFETHGGSGLRTDGFWRMTRTGSTPAEHSQRGPDG